MTIIKTEELKALSKFKNDLTLDGKIVILPRGAALTQDVIKTLQKHFIETVCVEETKKNEDSQAAMVAGANDEAVSENLRENLINETISEVDGAEFGLPSNSAKKSPAPSATPAPATATTSAKTSSATPLFAKAPTAPATAKAPAQKSEEVSLSDFLDTGKASDEVASYTANSASPEILIMETSRIRYQEFVKYIQYLYTHFATHKSIDASQLGDEARSLAVFIRDNKRYVLRLVSNPHNRAKNFLVIHAMRSTVFAVIIALEMKLDITHIRELATACILHEIGMLRLPPQLYLINRRLVPSERNLIATHPVYGYNILKAQGFPPNVSLAVLEHHEKENGLGYPRRLPSDQISIYAKIINVACSFEAITAPRTYKDEQTTYSAMSELLNNPNRQYDENVLKALLSSMSRYPIGAFVYLNNGKVALVVDCNSANPACPIVEVIGAKKADGTPLTVITDEKVKITRALSHAEEDGLLKTLGKNLATMRKASDSSQDTPGFEKIDPVEFE